MVRHNSHQRREAGMALETVADCSNAFIANEPLGQSFLSENNLWKCDCNTMRVIETNVSFSRETMDLTAAAMVDASRSPRRISDLNMRAESISRRSSFHHLHYERTNIFVSNQSFHHFMHFLFELVSLTIQSEGAFQPRSEQIII